VELSRQFDLGPIDQIAFAVIDVEARLPAYRAVFGDFVVRRAAPMPEYSIYRGQPASASLIIACGRSGDVEIELILEHLRKYGEGLHHVRFPVADHDQKHAELEAAGFTTVLRGRTAIGAFSYLEAPALLGHSTIELIEFAHC
jgi:hypothetical protein